MATGWGRGIGAKPPTREERAEARRLARIKLEAQLKKLDRKGKIAVLARAIAACFVRNGEVSIQDCIRAGFSESEAKDFFPEAIVIARRLEPNMLADAA